MSGQGASSPCAQWDYVATQNSFSFSPAASAAAFTAPEAVAEAAAAGAPVAAAAAPAAAAAFAAPEAAAAAAAAMAPVAATAAPGAAAAETYVEYAAAVAPGAATAAPEAAAAAVVAPATAAVAPEGRVGACLPPWRSAPPDYAASEAYQTQMPKYFAVDLEPDSPHTCLSRISTDPESDDAAKAKMEEDAALGAATPKAVAPALPKCAQCCLQSAARAPVTTPGPRMAAAWAPVLPPVGSEGASDYPAWGPVLIPLADDKNDNGNDDPRRPQRPAPLLPQHKARPRRPAAAPEWDAMATAPAAVEGGGAVEGKKDRGDLPPRWKRGGAGGSFGSSDQRRAYFFNKAVAHEADRRLAAAWRPGAAASSSSATPASAYTQEEWDAWKAEQWARRGRTPR